MSNWLVEDHGEAVVFLPPGQQMTSTSRHWKANCWREGMARLPNPGYPSDISEERNRIAYNKNRERYDTVDD